MQARSPAGYSAYLSKASGYKSKKEAEKRRGKSSSKSSSRKEKEPSFKSERYEGSDAYKANKKLISQAGDYKARTLDIAKGRSDKGWVNNQFKGIKPMSMPGDPKMPKLDKVKGYSGKESWQGMKTNKVFKPEHKTPKRQSASALVKKYQAKK